MAVIKTIGRSGQIALGKEYGGQHVLIDEIEPGVWLVKLGTFVPDNERWLWDTQPSQVYSPADRDIDGSMEGIENEDWEAVTFLPFSHFL